MRATLLIITIKGTCPNCHRVHQQLWGGLSPVQWCLDHCPSPKWYQRENDIAYLLALILETQYGFPHRIGVCVPHTSVKSLLCKWPVLCALWGCQVWTAALLHKASGTYYSNRLNSSPLDGYRFSFSMVCSTDKLLPAMFPVKIGMIWSLSPNIIGAQF